MNRRRFLEAAAIAAAAPLLDAAGPEPLIDTQVYLDPHPYRSLPASSPAELSEKLARLGVTEAWAGSFRALLHRDFDAINRGLASACQGTLFRPIGAVNPKAPGWRESLRRIAQEHHMTGLRLHPDYHGYSFDDPDFLDLLLAARDLGLLVQISLRIEDSRTQHPAVPLPEVNPAPLAQTLAQAPGVRVQLLNAFRSLRDPLALQRLGKLGVAFEIATLEGIAGIRDLLDRAPEARLAFGSLAPFFTPEAALLKLQESLLTPPEQASLRSGHARNLLPLSP